MCQLIHNSYFFLIVILKIKLLFRKIEQTNNYNVTGEILVLTIFTEHRMVGVIKYKRC